jgi:hypothetical protein
MLVDHLIDFRGCDPWEHDHHYDEEQISMSEFINVRNEIFDEVPTVDRA